MIFIHGQTRHTEMCVIDIFAAVSLIDRLLCGNHCARSNLNHDMSYFSEGVFPAQIGLTLVGSLFCSL